MNDSATKYDAFKMFRTWRDDWKKLRASVRAGTMTQWQFVGYWAGMLGLGLLMILLLPLFLATNTRKCPRCQKPNMNGKICDSYTGCGGWK